MASSRRGCSFLLEYCWLVAICGLFFSYFLQSGKYSLPKSQYSSISLPATTVLARIRARVSHRILVTGGAGFIGFHLLKSLKNQGHYVVGLDTFNNYYSMSLKRARAEHLLTLYNISVLELNVCDDQQLEDAITYHSIDSVVHLASQPGVRYSVKHPKIYVRQNVACFLSVLEVLRRLPSIHLVYASSSSVYGMNPSPFSERDRTDRPASLYAVSKKSNEALAFAYHHMFNISSTGLRFFTVYGPWGRPDMAYFSFTDRIMRGLPITVFANGSPRRDFTYIDDIIDGVSRAVSARLPLDLFNLGCGRSEGLMDLIRAIERSTGHKAILNFRPELARGDMRATHADISRARTFLGYNPGVRIEQGVRQFVQWYKGKEFQAKFANEGVWNNY